MSASETGPLDNDLAMDLCYDLRDLTQFEVISELERVLSSVVEVPEGGYLDRDLGEPAVAASAIVLAKFRNRVDVLREAELVSLVPEIPARLFPLALSALQRVTQDDSEVCRLWEEAGGGEKWKAEIDGLLSDIRAAIEETSE